MINDKTTFSTLYQNIITHIKDYESCDKLESHTMFVTKIWLNI